MVNITDLIKFNKSQQSYHARKSRHLAQINSASADKHQQTSLLHAATVRALESLEKTEKTKPLKENSEDDLFSLNPLKMQDLPDDLSVELNVSQSDTEDAQVLELLRIADRPLDLNELLVGCYRKYEVKHKRNLLTARVYRLAKRSLVHTVGKGTYALGPAPENQDTPNDDPTEK